MSAVKEHFINNISARDKLDWEVYDDEYEQLSAEFEYWRNSHDNSWSEVRPIGICSDYHSLVLSGLTRETHQRENEK